MSDQDDISQGRTIRGEAIGRGPHGTTVYLALAPSTGVLIAHKEWDMTSPTKTRERLLRVAQLAKDLDHPNVLKFLGYYETPTSTGMYWTYVPGGSLADLVHKYGAFEDKLARSFMAHIVDGLAYLHSKGIIHGNLTPTNVLVDNTGRAVLSDFALLDLPTIAAGAMEDPALRQKVAFLAPEALGIQDAAYGAAADSWSVGCVLLYMMSGAGPWGELGLEEVVQRFQQGDSPPVPNRTELDEQENNVLNLCFASTQRLAAAELKEQAYFRAPRDASFNESSA